MSVPEDFPQLTPLEYLEWEDRQERRHEFIDGVIITKPSETTNHDRIAVNFSTMLQNHLQSTVFRVFDANVKVQILASNSFLYPDVSVSGDVHDRSANKFISHPCLIVEVLSPSTEAYDSPLETLRERGDKFGLYRHANLEEYVLVNTNSMKLDIHRRNEQNRWELSSYESGDMVELKSVNFSFEIDRVYENIVFEI